MAHSIIAEIKSLFEEFDTPYICVSDFGITISFTRVDYIVLNEETNGVEIWAGNPVDENDMYGEELILNKKDRSYIFREILKYI